MTNQAPTIIDTFRYNHDLALHFHDGLSADLRKVISPREMYYIVEGQAVRRYESTIKYLKTYDSVCVLMRNESSIKVFEQTFNDSLMHRGTNNNSESTERVLFFYDSRNRNHGTAMLWLPGNIHRPICPIRFDSFSSLADGYGNRAYYETYAETFNAHPVAWMKHMICEMLTISREHRAAAGAHVLDPGWRANTDEFRLMPYELCVGSRELMLDVWDGFVKDIKTPLEMKTSGTALCPGRESVAISGLSPTMSFGWWLESCGDYMITRHNDKVVQAFSDHLAINCQDKFPLVSGLPRCDDAWHNPDCAHNPVIHWPSMTF